MADFGGDLGQGPTASQIARQYQLGSIDEPLADGTRGRRVRRARPQCASRQRQARLSASSGSAMFVRETVPKQRRKRRPRIDAQTLWSKGDASDFTQGSGRQFIEYRFADDEIQGSRRPAMADPVALCA